MRQETLIQQTTLQQSLLYQPQHRHEAQYYQSQHVCQLGDCPLCNNYLSICAISPRHPEHGLIPNPSSCARLQNVYYYQNLWHFKGQLWFQIYCIVSMHLVYHSQPPNCKRHHNHPTPTPTPTSGTPTSSMPTSMPPNELDGGQIAGQSQVCMLCSTLDVSYTYRSIHMTICMYPFIYSLLYLLTQALLMFLSWCPIRPLLVNSVVVYQ